MSTFSGVLQSFGHRKVLTWHSPGPLLLFYLKKIITTPFTERCVHWWLGFPSPP